MLQYNVSPKLLDEAVRSLILTSVVVGVRVRVRVMVRVWMSRLKPSFVSSFHRRLKLRQDDVPLTLRKLRIKKVSLSLSLSLTTPTLTLTLTLNPALTLSLNLTSTLTLIPLLNCLPAFSECDFPITASLSMLSMPCSRVGVCHGAEEGGHSNYGSTRKCE